MVGIEILLKIEPDKRKEFMQTFMLLSRPDRRPEGCLGHSLYEDVNQSNRYMWIEHWTDFNTLEDHMGTERFQSFLGAIDVLGEQESLSMVEIK